MSRGHPRSPALIGKDLGNAYSCVAFAEKADKVVFVKTLNGETSFPSVIHFGSDGNTYFGEAAENASACEPERTLRYFKRALAALDGKSDIPPMFIVDGRAITAVDATRLILEYSKGEAEKQIGRPVEAIVLTVPHNFGDTPRRLTKQAALDAGYKKVRIADEPTQPLPSLMGTKQEKTGTSLFLTLAPALSM